MKNWTFLGEQALSFKQRTRFYQIIALIIRLVLETLYNFHKQPKQLYTGIISGY